MSAVRKPSTRNCSKFAGSMSWTLKTKYCSTDSQLHLEPGHWGQSCGTSILLVQESPIRVLFFRKRWQRSHGKSLIPKDYIKGFLLMPLFPKFSYSFRQNSDLKQRSRMSHIRRPSQVRVSNGTASCYQVQLNVGGCHFFSAQLHHSWKRMQLRVLFFTVPLSLMHPVQRQTVRKRSAGPKVATSLLQQELKRW